MKIALFSAFYPYRGGIAQFSAMLYRALDKENELKAYTFKRQYPNFLFPGKTQFVTDDDNADKIPARRDLDTINPFTFRKSAKRINEFQPDLFISQYWMTFFGPSQGTVHKRLTKGTKRITILHNVIPHEKRFFDKGANNYFLKQNEGFVVMSDAVLKDLLSLKPDAKYLRIDHPVYNQFGETQDRTSALKKLKLNPEKNYLLFFGFIRGYKGLDLLLRALTKLDDSIELIVAGEIYGSFDPYQEIIDKEKLDKRVHLFTDYISDDQVSDFFSASDVCMLPYKSATQSGITAIAHHFDLPIIATDVGGLKESVHHESNGLIVPTPDPEAISEAISRYFKESMKEKMSQRIASEKKDNSWENFAEKLLEFSKTV
jgi:glycosyltransferase involved in cell wall biosynthesis